MTMKRLILFPAYLFLIVYVHASDESKWNTLYSYFSDVTMMQTYGTIVYGVSDGNLFSYDSSDSTFETYGKIYNEQVVSICTVDKLGCLAIGYEDSNIQLLYPNGDLVNIPGIKNTQWSVDKTINEISASDTLLYVSTNFGVVIINAEAGVVKESCILDSEVYSACDNDTVVYLATSSGVLKGKKTSNLQDKSNWESFPVSSKYPYSNVSFEDTEITKTALYKGLVHFLVAGKLICALKADGTIEREIDSEPTNMTVSEGQLVAFKSNVIYNFSDLYTFTYAYTSLGDIQSVAVAADDTLWVGFEDKGLSQIKVSSDNTSTVLHQELHTEGPLSNYPAQMKYEEGKLLVVGGGFRLDRFLYPAAFSIYDGSKWKNSDIDQLNLFSDNYSYDFASVAMDPSDTNHYFVASWGEGIYEFNGTECVAIYNTTNSTLQDITGNLPSHYIRVTGLNYDANNNLWMVNTLVDNTVTMMTKDGEWKEYSFSELKNIESLTDIMIDQYENKWIIGSIKQARILIWNDNETVDDASDDTYKYVSSFVDQDDASLDITEIKAIREDLEGNIWVGTDIGPFKIYNSSSIVNKSLVLNKIKIPRDDGTNYVDILLENVEINDIVIDGANQKWFATESSGIYLISADGLSTVYHFTKDNSILPSNRILSLAMDKASGLIYIGTDRGIVSYQSSFVEGNSDYSNVYTYPNPVRPDYYGDITVKGLQYDSTVKITDLNGNVINQGTSSGGTYIWSGKDIRGVRVKTGVYLVFAATESGGQGVVTKILVVNY
ncbi:MAG: hypothetical protein H6Q14_1979 [Bacteroidetes bacterium]|nr:hypothetical protein [Bacteroidota bacterium]